MPERATRATRRRAVSAHGEHFDVLEDPHRRSTTEPQFAHPITNGRSQSGLGFAQPINVSFDSVQFPRCWPMSLASRRTLGLDMSPPFGGVSRTGPAQSTARTGE